MDIKLIEAPATADERQAVDDLLGAPQSQWEGGERIDPVEGHLGYGGAAMRARRHLLLPALQAVQSRIGWISEGAMDYVCERLNVPPADAWGVATFYALLATNPRPRGVVHVCDDIACKARGADGICAGLESRSGAAHSHAPRRTHTRRRATMSRSIATASPGCVRRASDSATRRRRDSSSLPIDLGPWRRCSRISSSPKWSA
jgi:hypothetical protein